MLGLSCLWTNMMVGDLGRHGETKPYADWRQKFGEIDCIVRPTRTQGLVEKHHDSLKNVFLEQKNCRLDVVIPKLALASKSLKRQYDIRKSRPKPKINKVKKTVANKSKIKIKLKQSKKRGVRLATERFKGKNKASGKGFYQQAPPAKEVITELPQEWSNIPLLQWGGKAVTSKGTVEMENTCPLDNFFWILHCWYLSQPQTIEFLKENDSPSKTKLFDVVSLLLSGNFDEAKLMWVNVNKSKGKIARKVKGALDFHGSDGSAVYAPVQDLMNRKFESVCSSAFCPKNMTTVLYGSSLTDVEQRTNVIEASITEW